MGFISLEEWEHAIELYSQGKLAVLVDKRYPFDLAGIKQAHLDFQNGSNTGKKIIVFGE
jgi:NADPH:quinone reductase-like Zn-dependent oxidoreductase